MEMLTVYFQIYGKKMKVKVPAKSEKEAINIVRSNLKIDAVKKDSVVDFFHNLWKN